MPARRRHGRPLKVTEQADLRALNTFGVPARAALLVELEHEEDLLSVPSPDPATDLVLGGGSNVLLTSDVPGTAYLNRIRGIDVVDETGDDVTVEVGAGEDWHGFVRQALDRGWHGVENLSLIPGLAGAAPIQNIGAYGVELASVLHSVTAWDIHRGGWAVLPAAECALGYRDSRFKSADRDRYLITSIRLRLSRRFEPHLHYAGLAEALGKSGAGERPTARQVSDAVIRLRRDKLPDPAVQGNAGSFFKNPVVSTEEADRLMTLDAGLPRWPQADGRVKISAARLIDRCELKGARHGGAAVSERHALVLVNTGEASGEDVWRLARHVRDTVESRFGIRLEPEPRIYRAGSPAAARPGPPGLPISEPDEE